MPRLSMILAAMAWVAACGDSTAGPDETTAGAGGGGDAGEHDTGFKPVPCPDSIPEFGIGLEVEGEDGRFNLRIVDASPSPPEKFLNHWVVEVTDTDGQPVADADFTERPQSFMPVHGHDGARPIAWEPLEEAGQFDVDMINMWMGGPWEVRFWVTDGSGAEDYVVFEVCIED